MPRKPKPRKWRKWYVTDLGGRRHKLCLIKEGLSTAHEALDRLKVERHDNSGRFFPNFTVAELAVQFLQQLEVESPHAKFLHYQTKLKPLIKGLLSKNGSENVRFRGFADTPARQIHLKDGIAYKKALKECRSPRTQKPLGPCTINHHLRAAKRLFNWAVDEMEFLPKNPWRKIKRLSEEGRQRIATDAEFQALLDHCTDDLFRDIIFALRYTAARPGELRMLTWNMINWELHCWVIPAKKTKTGSTTKDKKPRIIPMLPEAETLLRERLEKYGQTERVFPGLDGKEWKKATFSQRFRRLRKRAGIKPDENGEQLVPYSLRHTRLTEAAIVDELPVPILQKLAGHTTFRMTQRYLHPTDSDIYEAILKARRRSQSDPK